MKRIFLLLTVAMISTLIVVPVGPVSAATTPCDVWGSNPYISGSNTAKGKSWIDCEDENINAEMIRSQVQHKDNHWLAIWHNLGASSTNWSGAVLMSVTASGWCDGQGTNDWYKTKAFGRDQFDRSKTAYSSSVQRSC